MLLQFFALVLAFSFAISCPPSEDIHPCLCQSGGVGTYVECSNIDNENVLFNAISALRRLKSIYMLTIEDISLLFIPHDLFHGMNIHRMEFKNSSVMSYSNTDVAFEGLEDSLVNLRFVHCGFMNSWDWSVFKNLRKLKELDITGGDMQSLQDDIRQISHLKLRVVTISKTKVSYIDDYAFANFTELNYLKLSSNMITEVKRSMLPDPAYELNEIDLQDNELMQLPVDFFTNMPNLQYVVINKNKFLTLKEETLAPVWMQLETFDAHDNKFRCDCRLKWIVEKPPLKRLGLICSEPSQLRGKMLENVNPKDLWC